MTPEQAGDDRRRLEPEHVQKYYSIKLPNTDFGSGGDWKSANCCFHPDQTPSLSVHTKTGNFLCHGCGAKGNIYSFEMRLLDTTVFEDALKSVHDIVGLKLPPKRTIKRIKNDIGFYRYEDENGNLLHELLRYRRPDREHTQYSARRRSADGRVWIDNANGVRRVIYNLPAVIKASVVLIAEGEKDVDRLASLGLVAADGSPVAVTCNPFGAGNWQGEYSQYLKGKRVVVMGDNDLKGINHIAAVCRSISPLVSEVRKVTLYPAKQEGEDKQDVSDYLDNHTLDELLVRIGVDWFKPMPTPSTIPIIA
jgi:DNA primase